MNDASKNTMDERLEMIDKKINRELLKEFLIWGTIGAICALVVFL